MAHFTWTPLPCKPSNGETISHMALNLNPNHGPPGLAMLPLTPTLTKTSFPCPPTFKPVPPSKAALQSTPRVLSVRRSCREWDNRQRSRNEMNRALPPLRRSFSNCDCGRWTSRAGCGKSVVDDLAGVVACGLVAIFIFEKFAGAMRRGGVSVAGHGAGYSCCAGLDRAGSL
jgi:hypothetical protein